LGDIKSVAKEAGVSVATVSRAFSHPDKVAKNTLKKIRKVAETQDYKPNSLAQSFRIRRTNTVVIIVPDLANAFFTKVLYGIEAVSTEAGISLLLANSHDSIEIERNCLDLIQTRRADGIIQLGARGLKDLVPKGSKSEIPFVQAIEVRDTKTNPCVFIDNTVASQLIVSHLISYGHKRIGVISGQEKSDVTQQRLNGYKNALKQHGLQIDERIIEFGVFSVRSGEEITTRLLDRFDDLTALFCMSDELAIGAMRAVRKRGLDIPGDLSITGFDNIEISEYTTPPLTTITQPARRIGKLAMQLMLDLLRGEPLAKTAYELPADLVVRGSVSLPNSSRSSISQ